MSSIQAPGFPVADIFDVLDNHQAEALLPCGGLALISALAPERVNGPTRSKTLGSLLSIELAVGDQARRRILLQALPAEKTKELERRTSRQISELQNAELLEADVRKTVEGFFGKANDPRQAEAGTDHVRIEAERGLFPHQKRVASELERYLFREDGRVMLHMPTGVGKTRTAMSVVATFLRAQTGVVLWLAATRELLEQAVDEFSMTWKAVGDRAVECLRLWGDHRPDVSKVSDGLVVAGLAKLRSFGNRREDLWSLGDRTTMVVFDEAHQAVAPTYRDLIDTIVTRNPKTPLLGLTATPGRTWNEPELDERVSELFHGNKVTLEGESGNAIKDLTAEGYLASVSFRLLNVEPGLTLSDSDLRDLGRDLDIPVSVADRLGDDEKRNLRILEAIMDLTARHDRVLVFAPSASNATLLASVCRGMGLTASAITATTEANERDRIVRRFKRAGGPTQVLLNFGVLTTGFDAPGASGSLIARPTKSLVLYSQMVGRTIRGPRAGGTASSEVVTVVDTSLPGFGDVAEAFVNWEDVWSE